MRLELPWTTYSQVHPCSNNKEVNLLRLQLTSVPPDKGFKSLQGKLLKWHNRNDLFDYVVMKSVEFIAGFINQVEECKETHTCCTVHQEI